MSETNAEPPNYDNSYPVKVKVNLTPIARETCPKCGEVGRRDTYQVFDHHLQRWLCGTAEHVDGSLMIGDKCYRNQLAAAKQQVEKFTDTWLRIDRILDDTKYKSRMNQLDAIREAMHRPAVDSKTLGE